MALHKGDYATAFRTLVFSEHYIRDDLGNTWIYLDCDVGRAGFLTRLLCFCTGSFLLKRYAIGTLNLILLTTWLFSDWFPVTPMAVLKIAILPPACFNFP